MLCLLFIVVLPASLRADDRSPQTTIWTGAVASQTSWVIFSGATAAPFGDLHHDGLRVRAAGGIGQYAYCFRRDACKSGGTLQGRATFSDILAGYATQNGALTTSVYAGAAFVDHDLELAAPHMASGVAWGPKLAVELWYDNGGLIWISVNSSATTAHNTFSWRGRIGYRVTPDLAVGPEFTIDGNGLQIGAIGAHRDVLVRSGAFARYTWSDSELSASAGIAENLADSETGVYGSITWATKF